ncbi:MAG: hypothetical protein PHY05_00510 [Methanothrix sp.]|nr:hypothetical protein [Methanothrix sp.]
MGLLDAYTSSMGEFVTWRHKTGVDANVDPVYSDSTISVLWYDEVKSFQTDEGRQLQQIAYILTSALVEKDDLITRGGYSWPVIGLGKDPSMGPEQMRKAYLGQFMI